MSSASPLVSVCIPAYNSAKQIKDAVNSVTNQTYANLEIIIVDDGSTDDTLIELGKIKDNRVVIFKQENKGASSARNLAISHSRGEFIQFLDADDMLSSCKIENQVNMLAGAPSKLSVCSTVHFDDGKSAAEFKPSPYEESFLCNTDDPVDFYIRLLGGYNFRASMVQTAAWLTHREIIKKAGLWNEDISLDDDGEFFTRVILASSGIIKSEGRVYYRKYPLTSKNLSSQTNHKAMTSMVNSVFLKEKHLFSKTNTQAAKRAIFRQLIDVQIKCYQKEPALYKLVTTKLKGYPKWRFIPQLGGKLINKLAVIFGWRFAVRLQTFYHRQRLR
jgi:glycosyltransferase involved in cell wall biosynthesis